MKLTVLIIPFFACSFLVSSCSKNNAGKGGDAQIIVKVIDGNLNVPAADVSVMYNARDFPSSTATYSDIKVADNTGDAIFDNLRRGDYYFYGTATIGGTLKEGGAFVNVASKFGETHVVIDFDEEDPF